MKLYYYKHPNGVLNFGDDLNPWLFGHYLSGYLDDDPSVVVFGIGTLLTPKVTDVAPRLIVMGSGTGYSRKVPVVDDRWEVSFVRGPKTAEALGLDPELAIADPAYLVPDLVPRSHDPKGPIGFMPHLSQADKSWRRICSDLGLTFIDPRDDPPAIVDAMLKCRLLVSEALHGAIVADAYGLPWIPIITSKLILEYKWADWLQSVGLEFKPHRMPTGWLSAADAVPRQSLYSLEQSPPRRMAKAVLGPLRTMRCRSALKKVLRTAEPVLSERATVASKIAALRERFDAFRREHPPIG